MHHHHSHSDGSHCDHGHDDDFETRDEKLAREKGKKLVYKDVQLTYLQLLRVMWGLYWPFNNCGKKTEEDDDSFHKIRTPEYLGGESEKKPASMTTNELMRWYERGKEKMYNNLRIETIVNKVLNLDIYNREM